MLINLPKSPHEHPREIRRSTTVVVQRGLAATTFVGCGAPWALVKAEDAKPNRTSTTRRSREFL